MAEHSHVVSEEASHQSVAPDVQEIPNPATKGNRFLIYVKTFMIEVCFHESIMSMSNSDYFASICSSSTQRLL